ncbi:transketolase [Streptococcus pneumoniae]|nr:transketolase [Streptococcus pneumoniae]
MADKKTVTPEEKKLVAEKHVDELVQKALVALEEMRKLDQEQVDYIVAKASVAALDAHGELALHAFEETGRGVFEDKATKNLFACEHVVNNMRHTKTVGVIEEDDVTGLTLIAEPVGVVCGITPTTNPTSTAIFKSLISLKTRNPIVFAFHPSAQESSAHAARIVRDAAIAAGAPENCVYNIFDHYTYVICGDGDLMEGVSSEAASYAGLQKLDKLVVLYDSNDINLDGETKDSFTESVRDRYNAYGWHTALVENGTDLEAIHAAIETAKASGKPSLIEVKTVIGYGSPNKQGTNAVHGAPLGADETASTRQALGWDYEPFEIPEQVYADFKEHVADRGASAYQAWTKLVADYKEAHPELAAEVEAIIDGRDPVEVTPADFPALENGFSQATRNSSQDALNVVAAKLPTFLGGSADLAHSNMTYIKTDGLQDDTNRLNRNIQFGVREFAMGTILNGMALHGGLRVYGGTFFVFSDYVKAAVRLSALQGLPVTYVFTHDSIAVGEDGPTHEPVEHLAGLRAMPNLNVFRPADARETQAAWYLAVTSEKTPTALVLTRQNLTVEDGTDFDKVAKGAYVVYENAADFDTILIATGSEVNLAVSAAKELASQGEKIRVVSMPSTDVFDKQDAAYKEEILPNAVRRRVAVEMGASQNWYKYVGLDGAVLGIDTFGASAPAPKVLAEYGFTVENLVKVVRNLK